MIGYIRRIESWIYQNPATGDRWEITEEEYETTRETVACYLTVRYVIPDAFEKPIVLSETIGIDMNSRYEREPATHVHLALYDFAGEVPESRLVLKLSKETHVTQMRNVWRQLYQEAMRFIHEHDVIDQIPAQLRHLAMEDEEDGEPFVDDGESEEG